MSYRVSCTMKQATLSAKTDGIVEVFSGEVAFTFDKHKILTIEVSSCKCVVTVLSCVVM